MNKTFEEAFEELKRETMEKYRELERKEYPTNTLDGPRALKERQINREFANKLIELKKQYRK
jgi:predicted metal-dependent peptidase